MKRNRIETIDNKNEYSYDSLGEEEEENIEMNIFKGFSIQRIKKYKSYINQSKIRMNEIHQNINNKPLTLNEEIDDLYLRLYFDDVKINFLISQLEKRSSVANEQHLEIIKLKNDIEKMKNINYIHSDNIKDNPNH